MTATQVRPIEWLASGRLRLLDQRLLPGREAYLELEAAHDVSEAIRDMVVRGAPAIGIAAAYGVALAARRAFAVDGGGRPAVEQAIAELGQSRPTAVNLAWALRRMHDRLVVAEDARAADLLLQEARAIHEEDVAQNRAMAEAGARLLDGGSVLTHCNTGSLATGGYGTALGVIRTAWAQGRISHVYATETRPWLQGARLTVWELARDRIPATLLVDSAAAQLIRARRIGWVIVGADRVAANGDVANKIGTFALALAARQLGARFMVVAPGSTLDPELASGEDIPIENRAPDEIWRSTGALEWPAGVDVYNPAFDVTPAALVDALVTERGVVERPDRSRMQRLFDSAAGDSGVVR
ncbi:MAG: S-methyl-5-thioribose-1-phosphate isomerase [Gammaproteobacteria bacterium]|jgi:methylthioribose-1-phosphate isomerase